MDPQRLSQSKALNSVNTIFDCISHHAPVAFQANKVPQGHVKTGVLKLGKQSVSMYPGDGMLTFNGQS